MIQAQTLSRRERQMIELISLGHSNKEIARRLFVSENTVKYHLKNAFRKLQVRARAQAVARAEASLAADPRSEAGRSLS